VHLHLASESMFRTEHHNNKSCRIEGRSLSDGCTLFSCQETCGHYYGISNQGFTASGRKLAHMGPTLLAPYNPCYSNVTKANITHSLTEFFQYIDFWNISHRIIEEECAILTSLHSLACIDGRKLGLDPFLVRRCKKPTMFIVSFQRLHF